MTTLIKNRYQINHLIGQGGMGAVYQVYDRLTQQIVALKQVTIPPRQLELMTRAGTQSNEKTILAQEFQTLSSLRHPNIISVLDYGFDASGVSFYTMDLIENSMPITDYAIHKPREDKLSVLIGVLQALRYLHQRRILHRDLKPANILIADGEPKLLDFGLALDASIAQKDDGAAGTLAYIAPEVLRGAPPSIESDLYAFGVIAYEVFTGHHPFPYETQSQLIEKILLDVPHFVEHKLDLDVQPVILRLLGKSADDRYNNAVDAMRALCNAANFPLPQETIEIRDSFLVASKFVGREEELMRLINALDDAKMGGGQSFLIAGESGVGKTRLMQEVRARALVQGATVIRGQGVTEAGTPYKIWRDILPYLLLKADVNDDEASILATLVPEISQLLGRPITPTKLQQSSISMRLPIIIADLLSASSKDQLLVLLLEDLQWASDSIEILDQVVQLITQSKILIIGNYRSDEAPHLPDKLSATPVIHLDRLNEQNIRKLSVAMLGERGRDNSVVDLIQRESEGNAFFIVEVVRSLADEVGELSNIGLSTLPAQVFAGGIQRIIQRRINKLPLWTLYPIQVSSVIGRQIKPDLVKAMMPQLDISKWLAVCGEVAIFSVQEENWQFTHDKIREFMIASLESEQTIAINLQVADTIEQIYADNIDEYAAMLTDYYHVAEHTEKEAIYAAKAADFLRGYDPLKAYDLAQRALMLKAYDYQPEPKRERARLNLLLGKTGNAVSEYRVAKTALDTALELYTQLGDRLGIAYTQNILGEWGYKTSKLDGAIELLEASLQPLQEHEDWTEVGSVYMNISIIYARQGDMESALPYFQKCVDTMLLTDDEVEIAKSYNNYAIASEMTGDFERGLEYHHKALEIRRRLKNKTGIATSLQNLAFIEHEQGNYEQAKAMRLEALQNARDVSNRNSQINILNGLAGTESALENYTAAMSYAEEALQMAVTIGDTFSEYDSRMQLGRLYYDTDPQLAFKHYFRASQLAFDSQIIPRKVKLIDQLSGVFLENDLVLSEILVKWLSSTTAYEKNYENFDNITGKLEKLQADMSQERYDEAVATGQTLQLDDVIQEIIAYREKITYE